MPDIDLEPGDYQERKPKGWRWRLPWRHPQDTKTPMVLFFVCLGGLGWLFSVRHEVTTETLFMGVALAGFCAGGQFILWLGRD